MSLNLHQFEAVRYTDGPALLLAGPGAGKTRVVTERFAQLLRAGANPSQILCLTFSKDAAAEMRARIAKITGFTEETLRNSVSTFHSLAYRLVIREKECLPFELSSYAILKDGQDARILREIVSKDNIQEAKAYIARMRRRLVSPEDAIAGAAESREAELARAYQEYDSVLQEEGVLDFDSMVYWAVRTLEANENARWREQMRWRFGMVDEAHDTSPDQKRFVELLMARTGNLVWVIDPSQAIYTWRGANCQAILDDGNASTKMFLGTNYRSGKNIIEMFIPFAETDELSQELVAHMQSGCKTDGVRTVREFAGEYDQASAVCEEIVQSGMQYEDLAVLGRTKAVLLPYCELLEERGIPYYWRSKNFWLSPEIQEAIAFCRFAINPLDREAFVTCCTSQATQTKYVGRKMADAIVKASLRRKISPLEVDEPEGSYTNARIFNWHEAREVFQGLRELRRGIAPAEFLREVQAHAGLMFYDSQTARPDDFSHENMEALIRRAGRFLSLHELVAHAAKMARKTKRTKGVTLSTIHSAKGLEWEAVYLVGVSEKILPHRRAENENEERRLMYVGLSRSRNYLWVSSHGRKSPFIDMLPIKAEENVAPRDFALAAQGE